MNEMLKLNVNWKQVMEMLIAILEEGSPEGREMARSELMLVAAHLDGDKPEVKS